MAADPVQAEAHATALAVTPIDEAARYLADRPRLGAVLVPDEGQARTLGPLPLLGAPPSERAA